MVVALYTIEVRLAGHANEYYVLKRNGITRHIGQLAHIKRQEKRLRNQDKYEVPMAEWLQEINSR